MINGLGLCSRPEMLIGIGPCEEGAFTPKTRGIDQPIIIIAGHLRRARMSYEGAEQKSYQQKLVLGALYLPASYCHFPMWGFMNVLKHRRLQVAGRWYVLLSLCQNAEGLVNLGAGT